MSSPIYFLTAKGNGYSPDGTLPAGAIICTEAQYKGGYVNVGGVPTIPTPPAPTLAQQAAAAINAGVAITSTGTPALDGTYACDDSMQAKINRVAAFIALNGKFPASLTEMPWPDMSGAIHLFPTTATFQAFASVVASYVVELDAVVMGVSTTLPVASGTIP